MANYNYDEAGNMAAYFLLTFLMLFLVPYTISAFSNTAPPSLSGCQCQQCTEQRERIRKRERGSLLAPKLRRRTMFLIAGWALAAFIIYRASNIEVTNKIYNPYEILGIGSGTTLKEIKSHYKSLSRKFHPDKVKLAVNETMEMVEAKFVEITKAYKSLTDENIRKNWETYGHPDGRQEVSMGIALPKWVVESGNNIWVLGAYGLIFGGALPALVGRWWFGYRSKTKDGVRGESAAVFFKSLAEESNIEDVVASLAKAFEWESPATKATKADGEVLSLEKKIQEIIGADKWKQLTTVAEAIPGKHENRRRAFILLYAHLLRLPISNVSLQKEQTDTLLQTPTLLNAMLTITLSRNWLAPAIAAMRLHAYLAQAITPGYSHLRLAQLPGVTHDEAASRPANFSAILDELKEKNDGRVPDAQKALERLGNVQIVDASFRVVGERFVTPASFVNLVLKLSLVPPTTPVLDQSEKENGTASHSKRDDEFLVSKKDVEDLPEHLNNGYAHAPYWPANRKPSWWIILADVRMNRVVVPPIRISDIPVANAARGADYRLYKTQFQAPNQVGTFSWRVFVVSDTFVGDEVSQDIMLKIDDPSVLNTEDAEDDISDPEEDSLAGQMALMRGGSVKKGQVDEESDDESSTDDEEEGKADDDSSSDSD